MDKNVDHEEHNKKDEAIARAAHARSVRTHKTNVKLAARLIEYGWTCTPPAE